MSWALSNVVLIWQPPKFTLITLCLAGFSSKQEMVSSSSVAVHVQVEFLIYRSWGNLFTASILKGIKYKESEGY